MQTKIKDTRKQIENIKLKISIAKARLRRKGFETEALLLEELEELL